MEGGMKRVVAVVVTWRRERELERLLASLERSTVLPAGCIVMDHAGTVPESAARREFPVRIFPDLSNPGPGAGWANGARRARDVFGETDILFLDDDVVLPPATLEILQREMSGARAICPLLEDAHGRLWGFPEPAEIRLRRMIREASTPADALRLLGPEPHKFCWATGACLLVDSDAFAVVGLHRTDFWMLGEDLEYSMRIASGGGGVFTCLATVMHAPPEPTDDGSALRSDRLKFCALLQNLSYLSFHSRHSAHMWRYLPGNYRRFFRTHGWGVSSIADASLCFWQGAVRGRPSGHPAGERLRGRIAGRELRR